MLTSASRPNLLTFPLSMSFKHRSLGQVGDKALLIEPDSGLPAISPVGPSTGCRHQPAPVYAPPAPCPTNHSRRTALSHLWPTHQHPFTTSQGIAAWGAGFIAPTLMAVAAGTIATGGMNAKRNAEGVIETDQVAESPNALQDEPT